MTLNNQPIGTIELVKIFANALVVWAIVMGFWHMTDVQQAVTLTMVMAGINLGGAFWQSRQTTPLANPTAKDGEPLVRVSGDATPAQHEGLISRGIQLPIDPPSNNPPTLGNMG